MFYMIIAKGVIQYYIGQYFRFDNHEWQIDKIDRKYVWGKRYSATGGWRTVEIYHEECRLHLRKLEDMTEEEMKELYAARTLWAYIQQSHINKIGFAFENKNCIQIHYSGPSGSSGYKVGNESMYLNQLMPAQFHYLLKQGFDLFSLIESGQAIDQKTLNEKA